jgi:GGDEF domain-containing protein
MTAVGIMIWSLALGAIAAVALVRIVDLAVRPSASRAYSAAFHAMVFGFVAALSGLPEVVFPGLNADRLRVVQTLAGPLCVGISAFWISGWLNARHRERLMAQTLRLVALLAPLAGLAALALPAVHRLPAAAAVSLTASTVTLWLIWRAAQQGDRLAPLMALGCLLTLPAIAGLYATAMAWPTATLPWQALFALCAALSNALTGLVLWRRDRHAWWLRQEFAAADLDPVTRLRTGVTLGQRLIRAQLRRRRTRREGAVLAVLIFNGAAVSAQAGPRAANEMFIALARRIQRQVGVVNSVGRYYDSCFICLVETIDAAAWLRTLALRLACALRRPLEVRTTAGQSLEIHPDVGVGVVHLNRTHEDLDDALYRAESMAAAARAMPSRTAMLDPATGAVVPVEEARLGPVRAGLTVRSSRRPALRRPLRH